MLKRRRLRVSNWISFIRLLLDGCLSLVNLGPNLAPKASKVYWIFDKAGRDAINASISVATPNVT